MGHTDLNKFKNYALANFTGYNQRESHRPDVLAVFIPSRSCLRPHWVRNFFRLLTRAGLMSLADVSSGDSCGLFGFLRVGPPSRVWGFGLLTRAGLMSLVDLWFS